MCVREFAGGAYRERGAFGFLVGRLIFVFFVKARGSLVAVIREFKRNLEIVITRGKFPGD